MADTDSSGSRQDREQTELWTTGTEQSSCNHGNSRTKQDEQVKKGEYELNKPRPMDDSKSEGLQGGGLRDGSANPNYEMADTSSKGRIRVRWSGEEESFQATGSLPLYPPGPGDREAWARLIARFPEVEPTFCKENHMQYEMSENQSELSRIIAGPSGRLDDSIRLRALGNTVVPAVAARAFIVLTEKLKKEVDIPDIIKEMHK